MKDILFRVKTRENEKLSDDSVVEDIMNRMQERYPEITGYQFERQGDDILLLMWGDLDGREA